MASLKEVKTRIASVNSTRKITSAMKMVASSKLHRAQQSIESMRPYEYRLDKMMSTFVASLEGNVDSPYAVQRDIHRVSLVLFTSNSSLCGGFNGNAIKAFRKKVENFQEQGVEVVKVFAVGKKGIEAVRKMKLNNVEEFSTLLEHPSYDVSSKIAAELMLLFCQGAIDKAELVYHHFKSAASQILTEETFLPITFSQEDQTTGKSYALDYIIEPSSAYIIDKLIPKTLYLKIYTALLDSLASEHAARIIAMQVATDNADELLRELKLTYNKTRQQAITTELLDIVGGSMQ